MYQKGAASIVGASLNEIFSSFVGVHFLGAVFFFHIPYPSHLPLNPPGGFEEFSLERNPWDGGFLSFYSTQSTWILP